MNRILYVEDDASLAYLTKDQLESEGFDVVHQEDGESGLKSFLDEVFDLCILDVMLPKMDGFNLAKEIRKRDPSIPIMFLSAKSLKEDKLTGLRLGGDDYITKPYSIEELILKARVFLRRREITTEIEPERFIIGAYEFDYPNLSPEISG